ncbi:hypothetical protein J2S74_002646 [Evansella vedderi]|uniref:Uncharacterized protein n=1 Tax=Evansella vedderi TaxID=38282 RepID=A0ABT9ZWM0_9BACI|nr:hypothetical protein [Evansella vedderi]MDQ0255264.1 hypothetical protein [Evansella vedderi]
MNRSKVMYKNEMYFMLFEYASGQVEIKKENSYANDIKLVRKDEIHPVESLHNLQ